MNGNWLNTANKRLQLAWRQSIWQRYQGHFHAYSVFCYMYKWNPKNPSCETILAYTEYLISKKLTYNTINNHLSGVKTFLSWHGYTNTSWEDPRIRWNRRSARIVLRNKEHLQSAVSFRHLLTCLFYTDDIDNAPIHLSLILCFIGLLRISNVSIPSVNDFDVTRHTQICDVEDEGDAIKICLKWSKSNQYSKDSLLLPIAKSSVLCPVRAWRRYRSEYLDANTIPTAPLLLYKSEGIPIPFTNEKLRHSLMRVFDRCGYKEWGYTPHSLRRGGATFFAESGVPVPAIKRHGKWKSEAIELYLKKMYHRTSPVFDLIKRL